jgi:chromate transporter
MIKLFLSFLKIGLFGFGGGYVMIPLIQNELVNKGWINMQDFLDIIAIAEMTPGPVAINSGTFIGYKVFNVIGAVIATSGVMLPSFLLVILLARFYKRKGERPYVNNILRFLSPTVVALVLSAAFIVARTSIIDMASLIIMVAVFLLMWKTKIHPITLIIISGLAGLVLYSN